MFKNILKILAVFIVGTAGGVFADKILLNRYKAEQGPVYVTEKKEVTNYIQENIALREAAEKVGKIQYGELKETLADSLARYFVEFRARRAELLSDQDVLAAQLAAGAKKARALAEKTMRQTRRLVGIG